VSPAFGEVNVIGMNLLSRLKSWGVQDGEMVLVP
jgi:aspartyl protease family protein